jgi:hypothetical protein
MSTTKPIEIIIYRITGKQFFFNVADAMCEECELTVGLTKKVLLELGVGKGDARVTLTVKPWVEYSVEALRKGGWHAPVLLIDGKIFSQGIVPNKPKLKEYLEEKLSHFAPAENVEAQRA